MAAAVSKVIKCTRMKSKFSRSVIVTLCLLNLGHGSFGQTVPSISLPEGLTYSVDVTTETVTKGGGPISRKGMPEGMKAQVPEGTPSYRGEFSVETTRIKIPEINFDIGIQREWIKSLPETPDSEAILWGLWTDGAKETVALAFQKDSQLWLFRYEKSDNVWNKVSAKAVFEVTEDDRIKKLRFVAADPAKWSVPGSALSPTDCMALLVAGPRSAPASGNFAWRVSTKEIVQLSDSVASELFKLTF